MLAHTVNRAFAKEKTSFFSEAQIWPLQTRMDPDGWLTNFSGSDVDFAVHLLNGFCYFSNSLVDQLFVTAFRRLSRHVVPSNVTTAEAKSIWAQFMETVIVTYPTGETPSVADSGHLFARRARDLVGIPEARILAPETVLERAVQLKAVAVVFVDDFVGSGSQFLATLEREYGSADNTFWKRADSLPECYYIPLFCTRFALENTLSELPKRIKCVPLHELGAEYSALSDRSIFWPPSMAQDGPEFIKAVSKRLDLPDTNGQATDDWQGFGKLGLGIAFEHQIPDACIPLFYTTKDGWRPLWRRA